MRKFKRIIALVLTILSVLCLCSCSGKDNVKDNKTGDLIVETDAKEPASGKDVYSVEGMFGLKKGAFESPENLIDIKQNPVATIKLKTGEIIKVELYYKDAPNTVCNFISLANSGFYDGLTFHRVIKNFMIQGGCPVGNGTGSPGYSIRGEFSSNGFYNNISHTRGTISMGRTDGNNDSAGSQFFICHADHPDLDALYSAFGKVIEGIAVVDAIAVVETDLMDKPLTDVIMESVRVDTFGVTYPEPEKINK